MVMFIAIFAIFIITINLIFVYSDKDIILIERYEDDSFTLYRYNANTTDLINVIKPELWSDINKTQLDKLTK